MSDISMCNSELCMKRESCYRSTATPSKYMQTFFTEAPFEIIDGLWCCDYYWDNSSYEKEKE